MNPRKYHLARSFALGFRDGFVIIGAMYMVITAVDLFHGTDSIRPVGSDYIMFMIIWGIVFVVRAAFGRHPSLPPRPVRSKCLYTQYFHAADAPAPVGAYSQAVARGDMLAVSGQVGIHPGTGILAEGVAEQTHQALANLLAVVRAAGAPPASIIHIRVYLADRDDVAAMNAAYEEFFERNGAVAEALPARTTIAAGLPEGLLVEIEALGVHQS